MTLLLQYNVNNHVLDGAHHLWWLSVLSVSESVCTEQGSTEFRNPLCVILAMPLFISYNSVLLPFLVKATLASFVQTALIFVYSLCRPVVIKLQEYLLLIDVVSRTC